MYDVLIPTAKKDFLKFRFVYDSIMKNLNDGLKEVYCVSNVKVPKDLVISGVQYFLDDGVLDFDFSKFKLFRKGWYVQQFIKLFQEITSDDYLVVDSDVCFLKKINIFERGKPTFLFGRDQHHLPYFAYMKKVFNLDRIYPYSFINEVMLFKRDIIRHMVSSTGFNKYGFFELSFNILSKETQPSGFSEYELYGNYVTKYFKDLYNYKYLKTKRGRKHRIWKVEEIQQFIDSCKDTDYDMVAFHSWITEQ